MTARKGGPQYGRVCHDGLSVTGLACRISRSNANKETKDNSTRKGYQLLCTGVKPMYSELSGKRFHLEMGRCTHISW
jgi:hypothetical protein